MFFGTGALKNFANRVFVTKVAGLKACNFIKKRLQHRCFFVKFAKSLRAFFTKQFRRLLLEISYELSLLHVSDESCHCVVRIGSLALISFYYMRFVSFYFLLFFLIFLVDFTTCLGIEVSLSILKIKQWSCS